MFDGGRVDLAGRGGEGGQDYPVAALYIHHYPISLR